MGGCRDCDLPDGIHRTECPVVEDMHARYGLAKSGRTTCAMPNDSNPCPSCHQPRAAYSDLKRARERVQELEREVAKLKSDRDWARGDDMGK